MDIVYQKNAEILVFLWASDHVKNGKLFQNVIKVNIFAYAHINIKYFDFSNDFYIFEKERKKSFPEIVDKVIKVINLGFGLGQDLNQVEEIEDSDDVKEAIAEGEMMEDAEQTKTINEVIEEVPIKLTDEELKQKMKASLGMMIEQQALGQLEGGPK